MKPVKYLLLIIISLNLFGCSSNKEAVDTRLPSNAIISMEEFSLNNDLTISNSAGGYLFTRPGVRLHIYPHVNYIRYNGQTIRIPDSPFVQNGELFIPLSLVESLPDSFEARKQISNIYVILDAGHGGEDTGAMYGNAMEKDIVLDIARRTQRKLAEAGVASDLTRDDDYFITLDERSRIANRHPGAIFISIHANAASAGTAQGIETYYLSSKISDRQRAQWAATEYDFNTAGGALSPRLEVLAAERMSYDTRSRSKILAQFVQSNIIENLSEVDRGVKQENFSVLRESFFGPAILIETGFLSHTDTRNKLITPAYRQRMAENIAKGIMLFIQSES